MTYEEARRIQKSYPNPYYGNSSYRVAIVVPDLQEDRINYLKFLKSNSYSEDKLKEFSTDNQFNIEGFDSGTYSES